MSNTKESSNTLKRKYATSKKGLTRLDTKESKDIIKKRPKSLFGATYKYCLLLLSLTMLLLLVNVSTVHISGKSMENTFHNGQYVIRNIFNHNYKNGDVVTVEHKADNNHPADYTLIKRVIATPKQNLRLTDNYLELDNKVLNESYIKEPMDNSTVSYHPSLLPYVKQGVLNYTLKSNEYFVMGDNRNNSNDSRELGAVPKQSLSGKVIFKSPFILILLVRFIIISSSFWLVYKLQRAFLDFFKYRKS